MSLWTGWRYKPPQGTPLNRAHPLVNGLICFVPINEGSGPLIDAVNGLTMTLSASAAWGRNLYGSTVNLNATSARAVVTLPPYLQLNWPITIACGFNYPGGGAILASNEEVFGILPNSTNATPFQVAGFYQSSSSELNVAWNSGGTFNNISSALSYIAGDQVISLTITSSAQLPYLNGVLGTSASNSLANPTYSANAQFCLGDQNASNNTVNSIYWAAIWNRVLTAAEHLEIGASVDAIWQIFSPSFPFWFGDAAAAAPGGSLYWPGRTFLRPVCIPLSAGEVSRRYD
jgi:hypothetical protein